VLEGQAAGLPFVVTPAVFEGLPPISQRFATVADTPDRFADAIVRALDGGTEVPRPDAGAFAELAWDRTLAPLTDVLVAAAR
jgi:hypothetical protein